MTSYRISV